VIEAFLSHEHVAAAGAIFSGFGSVTSAIVSYKVAHRRATADCEKRILEIRDAFFRGVAFEKEEQAERRREL
jgi:hypothetical protein